LVNTDELEDTLFKAERRVLEIQTKLHRWSADDPARRFDDLYNLVGDPAFLPAFRTETGFWSVFGDDGAGQRVAGWCNT
jgi:hypothetical protein